MPKKCGLEIARRSVVLRSAILRIVVLWGALELSAAEIADDEAHTHADEAKRSDDHEHDSEGRGVVADGFIDFMLAVAVHGHSVANVREKVVAAICAEACALEVSLEDFEDGVVFGALGAVNNAIEEGALVKTGRSQLVCHHLVRDLRGENPGVSITGAFIGTEHLLTSKEDLIQLVDHASL